MQVDRQQQWQALVCALENLLSGRIGLTDGSREVLRCGHRLALDTPLFNPFLGYDSESDAFPLGDVRTLWSADGLQRMDRERAEVEEHYRDWVLRAARDLLNYAAEQNV